jgi:hypothetical protein
MKCMNLEAALKKGIWKRLSNRESGSGSQTGDDLSFLVDKLLTTYHFGSHILRINIMPVVGLCLQMDIVLSPTQTDHYTGTYSREESKAATARMR